MCTLTSAGEIRSQQPLARHEAEARAEADLSPGGKWGSVRSLKPSGQRLPPTTCCPTQVTICAMLTGDPLLPHWLMISGALCRCSISMHLCHAWADRSSALQPLLIPPSKPSLRLLGTWALGHALYNVLPCSHHTHSPVVYSIALVGNSIAHTSQNCRS